MVPEKVTVVPVFSLLRFKVVEDGTAKLERTIAVQEAVAEATSDAAVTVHVPVLLDPLAVVVLVEVVEVVFVVEVDVVFVVVVDVVFVEVVEVDVVFVEVVDAADGKHCE